MNLSPAVMNNTDKSNSKFHTCKNNWCLYSHLPHDTNWSIDSYQNIIDYALYPSTFKEIISKGLGKYSM